MSVNNRGLPITDTDDIDQDGSANLPVAEQDGYNVRAQTKGTRGIDLERQKEMQVEQSSSKDADPMQQALKNDKLSDPMRSDPMRILKENK